MTYVSPDPQVCVVKVTRQDLVLHFKPIQADINDISLGPCSDFHEGDVLVFFPIQSGSCLLLSSSNTSFTCPAFRVLQAILRILPIWVTTNGPRRLSMTKPFNVTFLCREAKERFRKPLLQLDTCAQTSPVRIPRA